MLLSSSLSLLFFWAIVMASSSVNAFSLVPPTRPVSTTRRWNAVDGKKAVEVVEDYRDNLKNSRTAPGHHDGSDKKVRDFNLGYSSLSTGSLD